MSRRTKMLVHAFVRVYKVKINKIKFLTLIDMIKKIKIKISHEYRLYLPSTNTRRFTI